MTLKEAYDKIDNTLCLNSLKLEFNIDKEEHIDCKDVEEMVDCLDTISDLVDIEEDVFETIIHIEKEDIKDRSINLNYLYLKSCYSYMCSFFYYDDYGKTWALTEEELENE